MSGFTPGPWILHGKGYRQDHTNGGEFVPILANDGRTWIADAREPPANARLIAAAPDLLAMVEAFVAGRPTQEPPRDAVRAHANWQLFEKARALIKAVRATGG